jgi:hypothetical protein
VQKKSVSKNYARGSKMGLKVSISTAQRARDDFFAGLGGGETVTQFKVNGT